MNKEVLDIQKEKNRLQVAESRGLLTLLCCYRTGVEAQLTKGPHWHSGGKDKKQSGPLAFIPSVLFYLIDGL